MIIRSEDNRGVEFNGYRLTYSQGTTKRFYLQLKNKIFRDTGLKISNQQLRRAIFRHYTREEQNNSSHNGS